VGRQLVPGMERGGMVAQKCRGMEGSTKMEVSIRMGQWIYFRQLNGQTLENPRTDLEES